jgi:hypothetical protein
MSETLAPLKVQWRAERRILTTEKLRIERRLAELDEMLATFFPEEPRNG